MSKSLFDIQDEYFRLMSEIEENEGVLDEATEESLKINREELEDKLRAYKNIIVINKSNETVLKDEIERLNKRKKAIGNLTDRLKVRITDALHIFTEANDKGIHKLTYPDFTVYTKNSESITYNQEELNDIITKYIYTNEDAKSIIGQLDSITKAKVEFEGSIDEIKLIVSAVEKYKLNKDLNLSFTIDKKVTKDKYKSLCDDLIEAIDLNININTTSIFR